MSVIAMVVQTKEEAGFFRKRVDIVGMRGSALISEMMILEKTKPLIAFFAFGHHGGCIVS